jgi:hypothetical protein
MKWFYMVRGDVSRHGLVEDAELAELAKSGRIGPRDLLWNAETGTKWVEAITIPGLFAAPPPSRIPPTAGLSPVDAAAAAPVAAPRPARRPWLWLALGLVALLAVAAGMLALHLAGILPWTR